jgi:hypothetical protein
MRARLAVALGLASASLLLAIVFAIMMWGCGAMEASPGNPGTCVPVFHPFTPVWAVFAVAGGVALWFGRAWPAVVLGSVGLALGILSGFSAGFYGIGCGALLLAAGASDVRRLRARRAGPPDDRVQ